jgi:hypothetical protein
LRNLTLRSTKITDAGLLRLAELPKLQSLDVVGTNVTPEGVAQFNVQAPHVTSFKHDHRGKP